ncbi:Fe2+-dependent dioxygenase [Caulobacter sp. 17J65-9]|uniref:Fe2+-dependent dioxygenase n=1 Tax=Caulobacter sp. 17J65-9 TaxID=2709382 RepID=UPI0013C650D7|nr:Fe2+-dependent dioxygenase [Caulobacter sp. 17J65-9]NEX92303.1 Fe2+-dependent dioxygenase [Caulobacter sp. 17J65-9]
MLLQVPDVLTPEQVAYARQVLETAPWADGRITAGHQSALAKRNRQLPQDCVQALDLGAIVTKALERNLLFLSAALPQRIYPPLFNRYEGGQDFGNHVDNAIRRLPDGSGAVRTDLSATLFLADPDEYDGGELTVDDTYGVHQVKLPAGSMVLYPASSLHRVEPVTRGARVACFFWIQSLVRDDARRTLLFDMDLSIQRLAETAGHTDPQIVALTGCYHNLLRMWAEP